MILLSLDPATHYTGYALWQMSELTTKGSRPIVNLTQYGVIRAAKTDWDVRCLELNSKIRNLLVKKQVTDCIGEFPQFQDGARGQNAARGGDTLKLAYLCGSVACGWQLHAFFSKQHDPQSKVAPNVVWLTPTQWKGQLPKDVTAERCHTKYGFLASSEIDKNASDAIMIGDYYMDKFGVFLTVLMEDGQRAVKREDF